MIIEGWCTIIWMSRSRRFVYFLYTYLEDVWNFTVSTKPFQPPMWVFPKIGVPQNGWFIIENPIIKMDDLGVPLFRKHPYTSLFWWDDLSLSWRTAKMVAMRTAVSPGWAKWCASYEDVRWDCNPCGLWLGTIESWIYDMDAFLQSTILRQRKILFWDECKYIILYMIYNVI